MIASLVVCCRSELLPWLLLLWAQLHTLIMPLCQLLMLPQEAYIHSFRRIVSRSQAACPVASATICSTCLPVLSDWLAPQVRLSSIHPAPPVGLAEAVATVAAICNCIRSAATAAAAVTELPAAAGRLAATDHHLLLLAWRPCAQVPKDFDPNAVGDLTQCIAPVVISLLPDVPGIIDVANCDLQQLFSQFNVQVRVAAVFRCSVLPRPSFALA